MESKWRVVEYEEVETHSGYKMVGKVATKEDEDDGQVFSASLVSGKFFLPVREGDLQHVIDMFIHLRDRIQAMRESGDFRGSVKADDQQTLVNSEETGEKE